MSRKNVVEIFFDNKHKFAKVDTEARRQQNQSRAGEGAGRSPGLEKGTPDRKAGSQSHRSKGKVVEPTP